MENFIVGFFVLLAVSSNFYLENSNSPEQISHFVQPFNDDDTIGGKHKET